MPDYTLTVRAGNPNFEDLPWKLPFSQWIGECQRLVEINRGISRHPILFANYDGLIYALKELPPDIAEQEYQALLLIEKLRLPAVTPVGHVKLSSDLGSRSVLITQFLEYSIPYHLLFSNVSLNTYRKHLLDAVAGLLVQIHLAGIYWGDCSLSNTLFRRDAGSLQAYLVDAETMDFFPDYLPPTYRHQDLDIMEHNIIHELTGLDSDSTINPINASGDIGGYIRLRYQQLWEEINREEYIQIGEDYIIQERIQAINDLGYSVGEVNLLPAENGKQLRIKIVVADRNYHRDQLMNLTGIEAEEMQARKMINELLEIKARLVAESTQQIPISVAANEWLEKLYKPTIQALTPFIKQDMVLPELYCQVLEHKWYLSEIAKHDVGHEFATEDYIKRKTAGR